MISLNLKEAYNNLDLDDKRNKLSDELLIMEELLKNIQNKNVFLLLIKIMYSNIFITY